jgi:hypothetical protein
LQLKKVWEATSVLPSSAVVKRGSPYFPFLFYQTLKLIEQGQVDRVLGHEHAKETCVSNITEGSPIGLEKLSILFILLCFGVFLSGFICCLEALLFKKSRKMPKHSNNEYVVKAKEQIAKTRKLLENFEISKNSHSMNKVQNCIRELEHTLYHVPE